jgi:aryl-alcohol dehydrogenase-like predicted oxidoreductase
MTATEFMLRATISNPNAHTVIVGTLNPDHLLENKAAALKGPLPDEVLEEAKRRLKSAMGE